MRERRSVSGTEGLYGQASFTVEAAIIVPLLMMIICAILWLGFELHDEAVATAIRPGALEEIDTMKEIRERDIMIRLMGE